jgi:hypothetical protein
MRARTALAALLMFLAGSAFAGTRNVDSTATGIGGDENEALADALAKAVAQVNGTKSSMSVSTGKAVVEGYGLRTQDGSSESSSKDDSTFGSTKTTTGKQNSKDSVYGKVSAGTTADARMSSTGSVVSYQITSTKQRPDGRYEVTVNAKVKQHFAETYNAPGSGKRRIAVVQPSCDKSQYDFDGVVSGSQLCADLWSELEEGLLSTGTFSLLDRKTLDVSLSELNLVASDLTNATEKAKLRNIRGTDLILISKVRAAERYTNESRNQATGQIRRSTTTNLDVEMRGVVPATGEILFFKRYALADANSRAQALAQIAEFATSDIAVALGVGKAKRARLVSVDATPARPQTEEPPPPAPPSQGVKLPFDR